MKEIPDKIYLQIDPSQEYEQWDEDVTWCEDKINDTDIEYIRVKNERTCFSEDK